MAAPVAVQRAEPSFSFDHFLQPCHHCHRRFFLHPLRLIKLPGGIVQNHDQVIPALVLKPSVPAALDVQQHAAQRPPWTPLATPPALAPPRHQSCPLQGLLHPAVAEFDLMLIAELLMKMPHVQIVIAVAIQPQYLLHQRQRHPLRRRLPTPPIKQSVIAELFVTFAPAPHVPVADADDLRCLPPRDLLRHGPQNHFLYFHRPSPPSGSRTWLPGSPTPSAITSAPSRAL